MDDFQQEVNRKGTKSLKWDHIKTVFQTDKDLLPMWVADMDFQAPEAVNDALTKRAEHGVYGYTIIDTPIKNSVISWLAMKHQWQIDTNWLVFSPGVITSLHNAIQAFTDKNDKILLQTPVYTPFFNLITTGNRQVIENPLLYNGETYEIDFQDFEKKLKQGVKAFILCSPHNPVGRVWTKEELSELARLCLKYDVLILADEIHADLVFNNHKHIPIASLSEEIAAQTVTCMSPTKTFNLAGLQASYLVIPNRKWRLELQKRFALQGFSTLNTFGTIALEAAYSHGKPWLDQVMNIIAKNKQIAREKLMAQTNQKIYVIDSEATYLLWLDCTKLSLNDQALQQFMIQQAKVGLNAGSSYGKEGKQFMRLNIACPKATLEKGIMRIVHAVNQLP